MTFATVLTLFVAFTGTFTGTFSAVLRVADPIDSSQGLDSATIAKVKANLENIATHRRVHVCTPYRHLPLICV